jgi:two-component system cell cycle sensor histidine kinase/response regulator CckA
MRALAPIVQVRLLPALLSTLLPVDAFAWCPARRPLPLLSLDPPRNVLLAVLVVVTVAAVILLVVNRRLQRRLLAQASDLAEADRALEAAAAERVRADRRTADHELLYRTLVEGSGAIPFRIEVQSHRYLYLGPQAEAILGRPASHWKVCQDWFELIHPDDRQRVERERRRHMGLRRSFDLEYRFLHADGSVLWLHEIVSFLTGRDEPDEAVGFILDFTAVKEAEARRAHLDESLREARKLESLGVLAGGIAHDLNNLLMPILGHLELLEMDLPPTDTNHDSIRTMRSAAQRARDLVRHLLAYSASQVLDFREVELGDVLGGAGDRLSRHLAADQDLALSVPDRSLSVHADTDQLLEAVENLVQNAADAMPGGGTVAVGVVPSSSPPPVAEGLGGEWVRIEVRDQGAGMAPEDLGRACEPFYTTKGRAYNAGLGLSTAHGIIRQHGGFLDLDSEPRRGTTVTLWLPLASEAAPRRAAVVASEPLPGLAGGRERPTILLVEDDDSVREYLARTLDLLGFAVVSAASGEEAVALIRGKDGRFDLVLTDVVMPRMSGWAVYETAAAAYPDLRFLFMSGYGDDILGVERAGTDGTYFIQKPFSRQTLATKLQQLLGATQD